jgi:hypothetical protein
MAEEYYCKYCGDSHAALSFLTSGVCPRSPNRRHQLYTGNRRKGRERPIPRKKLSLLLQVLRQFFPVNRAPDTGFLFRKPEQASPAGGIGLDSYT